MLHANAALLRGSNTKSPGSLAHAVVLGSFWHRISAYVQNLHENVGVWGCVYLEASIDAVSWAENGPLGFLCVIPGCLRVTFPLMIEGLINRYTKWRLRNPSVISPSPLAPILAAAGKLSGSSSMDSAPSALAVSVFKEFCLLIEEERRCLALGCWLGSFLLGTTSSRGLHCWIGGRCPQRSTLV